MDAFTISLDTHLDIDQNQFYRPYSCVTNVEAQRTEGVLEGDRVSAE